MRMFKLLIAFSFCLFSIIASAQEYYEFGEKFSDKGQFAFTPIAGVFVKTGGDIGFLASGRLQYFISEHISIGTQYVHLLETGAEDFGWIGDYLAPKQTINLVLGGHYFPSNRFGFHGTAGIGYILSGADKFTYYSDIGIDYKVQRGLTLQLQVIQLQGITSLGLGFQFKL